MLIRFGIRQKIFALFTIVAITPLVIINVIWLHSSQSQLKQAAANRQSLLLDSMAQRINESLSAKIDSVVTNSQDANVTDLSINLARIKLMQFANQDSDVLRIALVDNVGNEKVVINNGAFAKELRNIKADAAFSVVTLLSNDASVGEVTYIDGKPRITISVPLLNVTKLGDQNLTDTQALTRRYGGDINGALIVDVSLEKLWNSVLNTNLGSAGYMYLVNGRGELIAHRDKSLLTKQGNLQHVNEVKNAVRVLGAFDLQTVASKYKPDPVVSTSEIGNKVLSSNFPISRTKWALIGEEPESSVYSASYRVSKIALAIFAISVPLSIGFILLATRNIIIPIRELTKGALTMGSGDFSQHLAVKGNDELSVMAHTFNKMGDNLQTLLSRYREQNINLVAERTKLQAILDTIADGVIVLDQEFKIVLVNKTISSLTAQPDTEQFIGQPWLSRFTLHFNNETFQDNLLNGELMNFHDVTMQVGDQLKYIDITAIRLHKDPNGIAYILTIHDITQRRELDNMKLDFVSMAAHELRTPLTALSGYLDVVNKNKLDATKTQEFLRLASANATMLDSLINNLLSLSHIERNALQLNMHTVDWLSTVTEEVNNHRFAADAKKITVQTEFPNHSITIWGDEFALREVVGNLVSNAIHYTKQGGTINVKVTVDATGVTTTISDTGIGILPEAIDKLFTKYFRAEGGLTTNSQGTGIGLFISRTIVEAHNGKIGVTSEVGKGSNFYFTLQPYDENQHRQTIEGGASMKQEGKGSSSTSKRSKVDWF